MLIIKWEGSPQHSALLESNLQIKKISLYGRYEFIQKDAAELEIIQPDLDEVFLINALTLGANYNILTFAQTNLKAGIQGTIYVPDQELQDVYGNDPLAVETYLRLTPVNTNILHNKMQGMNRNH